MLERKENTEYTQQYRCKPLEEEVVGETGEAAETAGDEGKKEAIGKNQPQQGRGSSSSSSSSCSSSSSSGGTCQEGDVVLPVQQTGSLVQRLPLGSRSAPFWALFLPRWALFKRSRFGHFFFAHHGQIQIG